VLPTPAPEQETNVLKQQAESLQGQLDAVRKRLDELAAGATKD
jgi:prefoldin subunit 5